MARISGGGAAKGRKAALPSAQELMSAISGQFTRPEVSGMFKITGPQYKGLPAAQSYGEFDEIISVINANDTMQYYDRAGESYQNLAIEEGPQSGEDETAAELTVVPTSTTNPERPRTVAAGYDKEESKLTVVFRDGTFYNYYEVDPNEWAAFKARVSKGRYIYQYLDYKPRGPADVSSISQAARKAFYRFSRGSQLHYGGKQPTGKPSKPKKP
jgi:hypothetical protein